MSMLSVRGDLMVQGATSDAGKSILVTALARILARHRISVAPFKPQNMALNSAVTKEGGEIGRAQAVQAEACYLQPSNAMNPVLLKPNSDVGAQVIVNGQSIGNMDAQQYHQFKPKLLNDVIAAYQSLQSRYSVVLVEGAGSPAEINLREYDIANMGFAEAVDCPVIIVADIDRGGVFAHLYGTYALLSESERSRVKGFVINRFRGDKALLDPGLDWLEEKTGVPVLAVLPYIKNLHIESEDSLHTNQTHSAESASSLLKVVVPVYPRASNMTDFDVLRLHPQVDCQFLAETAQFQGADLIILPGSKNVRSDLHWLKTSGWDAVINRHLRYGGKLIGICGGYQMLGDTINDPLAIESAAGCSKGLGLLSMDTTLAKHKSLGNAAGTSLDFDLPVSGYEIHCGVSEGAALAMPLFSISSTSADSPDSGDLANKELYFSEGGRNADNTVWGTYLHGVFDAPDWLAKVLSWAGLSIECANEIFDYAGYRDAQINRLADIVEAELPVAVIAGLLGAGGR